jgi:hypothetical protein
MTLIAAFAPQGYPVVFGDLLLTGPRSRSDRPVAVPANSEAHNFFGDAEWGIAGLQQKVNLVGKKCAIAWAGSWLGARIAISGLQAIAESEPLTPSRILQYLQIVPDLAAHEASFVGMVSTEQGIHQFRFRAGTLDSEALGQVFFAGSGSAAVEEFSKISFNTDTKVTGTPTVADLGIAKALNLGGLLLQSEFRGGDSAATLRQMFGGGYEIAYFDGEEMRKYGDVTFVFWEALLTPTEVHVSFPQFLLKQVYIDGNLLIRSAQITVASQGEPPKVVNEQRHLIRPLLPEPTKLNPLVHGGFSFESRMLFHCIAVRDSNRPLGIYTRVQGYAADSEITIGFPGTDGQIAFRFRHDTLEEIAASIGLFRTDPSNIHQHTDG